MVFNAMNMVVDIPMSRMIVAVIVAIVVPSILATSFSVMENNRNEEMRTLARSIASDLDNMATKGIEGDYVLPRGQYIVFISTNKITLHYGDRQITEDLSHGVVPFIFAGHPDKEGLKKAATIYGALEVLAGESVHIKQLSGYTVVYRDQYRPYMKYDANSRIVITPHASGYIARDGIFIPGHRYVYFSRVVPVRGYVPDEITSTRETTVHFSSTNRIILEKRLAHVDGNFHIVVFAIVE